MIKLSIEEKAKAKFKVGDYIKYKWSEEGDEWNQGRIVAIEEDEYLFDEGFVYIKYQDHWELVEEPKKCMYSKDNYTDEDRKVLCKDCDEKCEYSKKEEPVDEDFLSLVDKEARELWKEINSGNDFSIVDSFNQFYGICMQVAESTVEWQKNLQEPVSNALEEELDKYIKDNFTIDKEQLDKFGIEEKDYMYSMDKSDMLKMIRYFIGKYKVPESDDLDESAKLHVADSLCITNEDDWDDAAIEALNMYKAGAKWQKEKDK